MQVRPYISTPPTNYFNKKVNFLLKLGYQDFIISNGILYDEKRILLGITKLYITETKNIK